MTSMKLPNIILQIPGLPDYWQDILNQQPIQPGLSTELYSTFYYIVMILGVVALILIVVFALTGEEKEERVGYE